MCQISDRIFSEGKMEGRIEGRIEGRREGKIEGRRESKTESIIALTEAMHISDEQAMELLQIDRSERTLYASRVKEMRAARGDSDGASV